ncbi:hypothetical protein BO94DRAFT_453418, partial [Aspergillus sclerotioniger CBS 115572]
LKAYHNDSYKSKSEKSYHDQILASYIKYGRLWWILAGTLGVSILLVGGELMKSIKNDSFNKDEINALITLVLNTYPGTIHTFYELKPVVKSLMFRQITEDLCQAILNNKISIFGR